MQILVFIPDQANLSSTSGGADSECAYSNMLCNTECASETRKDESLPIALGVVSALCVILVVLLLIISGIYAYIKYNEQIHNGGVQGVQEEEDRPYGQLPEDRPHGQPPDLRERLLTNNNI